MKKNIQLLKKEFFGKDCLIITAGPSLNDASKEKITSLAKDKVVIAVKQAYYFLPEIVDIHVINDNNYELYDYEKAKISLKVILLRSPSILSFTPKCDAFIEFKITRQNCKWENCLVNNKNFKDYEISENSLERPWGPGIMYEICIYFPILFNSNSVIYVAWDLGNKDNNIIKRYNDKETIYNLAKTFIINKNLKFYNLFVLRIENILRIILYYLGFNLKLGVPAITESEAVMISKSTCDLSHYYETNGIEHYIYSDKSLISECFQRI